jgi:hypothetical protein
LGIFEQSRIFQHHYSVKKEKITLGVGGCLPFFDPVVWEKKMNIPTPLGIALLLKMFADPTDQH